MPSASVEERLERGEHGERDRCRDFEGGLPGGDGRLTWSRGHARKGPSEENGELERRSAWTLGFETVEGLEDG